jgi:hypothetical protein
VSVASRSAEPESTGSDRGVHSACRAGRVQIQALPVMNRVLASKPEEVACA